MPRHRLLSNTSVAQVLESVPATSTNYSMNWDRRLWPPTLPVVTVPSLRRSHHPHDDTADRQHHDSSRGDGEHPGASCVGRVRHFDRLR